MTRLPLAHRRGSILIVAMWVIIALTGLVLSLSYAMRIEAIAGANRLAQAQADAAERGMEQFLISVVDNEVATPGTFQDLSTEARKIGDCQVWVVRPDWDSSAQQLTYGLTDEAGKIDLNTATSAMLLNLPGMTQEFADCIMDWRDSSTSPRPQGAKDDYYLSLPEPYHCKNGPYETVDELLLVKGITKDLLFGYDRNRNGILEPNEQQSGGMTTLMNSGDIGCGFAPFVTVYGIQATATGSTQGLVDVNGTNTNALRDLLRTNSIGDSKITAILFRMAQARRGGTSFRNAFDFYFQSGLTLDEFKKILPKLTANPRSTGPAPAPAPKIAKVNINTAPKEVLLCLPGSLDDADASAIISQRQSQTSDPNDISWLANPSVLSKEKAIAIGGRVTGKSIVYSGDVVAVSPDGRAFRRYRVVISGKATVNGKAVPTRIVYRRDLTTSGWPLPPEIRSSIRSGQGYQAPLQISAKGGSSL